MNPPSGWVRIGKIVAPHGLHGQMRVYPLTDFPQRFLSTQELALELPAGPVVHQVERAQLQGGMCILKLAGVCERSEAEKLRETFLLVGEERVVPLPENRYYIYQLLGLPVYTEQGRLLGKLAEVLPTGGNDVWVVQTQTGQILLPAIRQVIRGVDLEAKRIVVHLLPGLSD
jgi:16S rRNA processing protein RimM